MLHTIQKIVSGELRPFVVECSTDSENSNLNMIFVDEGALHWYEIAQNGIHVREITPHILVKGETGEVLIFENDLHATMTQIKQRIDLELSPYKGAEAGAILTDFLSYLAGGATDEFDFIERQNSQGYVVANKQ